MHAIWRWGGAVLCGAALLVPRPVKVTFTVSAPDSVRRGASVPITLRLTNTGNQTENLYLTGRTITFDIIVARADGQVVWRRLDHMSSQQILQVKTLAPGETFEMKDVWKPTVDPGTYTVQGVLPTDGAPLRTAAKALRITP